MGLLLPRTPCNSQKVLQQLGRELGRTFFNSLLYCAMPLALGARLGAFHFFPKELFNCGWLLGGLEP